MSRPKNHAVAQKCEAPSNRCSVPREIGRRQSGSSRNYLASGTTFVDELELTFDEAEDGIEDDWDVEANDI